MNAMTLKSLADARGLNQSDLARAAHVTRQSVSQWFRMKGGSSINIRSDHLYNLAEALGVSVDELRLPLPLIHEHAKAERVATELLWDRIYPDLVDFAIAVGRNEPVAVARLVQVYGLYATSRMLGENVWKKFPKYKHHLHPKRRTELEQLWRLRQDQTKR